MRRVHNWVHWQKKLGGIKHMGKNLIVYYSYTNVTNEIDIRFDTDKMVTSIADLDKWIARL